MTISFPPPYLEKEHGIVAVGVVTENVDVEFVAGIFGDLVDVRPVSDYDGGAGCDVVFRQCENRQEAEVLLPACNSRQPEHRILISLVSPYPALESVAHALLVPAFSPGGIGVDWEDVCLILRSGKRGVLAVVESGEAVTDTLKLAESVLPKEDRTQISGVMAVVFAPQGTGWMESVRQLGRAVETLAPDAGRVLAAPVILGDTPICAVLAVFPE